MLTRNWSEEDKAKAADLATSYVTGAEQALEEFNVEMDELEQILLDVNVEKCPSCDWFDDSYALLHPETGEIDGQCSNCREDD